MEYSWNYFHFHAACTFTGQLSTAEGRSSPRTRSVTRHLPSHARTNNFTRQRNQVNHLELSFYTVKLCGRRLMFYWFPIDPRYHGFCIRTGYMKVSVEVKCTGLCLSNNCTNSDESKSPRAAAPPQAPLASRATITPAIKILIKITP